MNYIVQSSYFAQAYGTGDYSCTNYSEGCANESTNPLAPLTGFVREQPPTVVIPVLLVAAVLIATVAMLVSKLVTKLRRS